MDETNRIPLTAVDRIADGNGLQMMKAAIPYLPLPMQRAFSLYAKCMEIQNVISYYHNPVSACSTSSSASSFDEILEDLRNYGTETQRQSMDQLLNLLHTVKMYQEYKDLF